MNKVYALIWSDARRTWIVAHEFAAARGKPASRRTSVAGALAATLLATLLCQGAQAQAPAPTALPTGGQVVAGQASVTQSGNALNIQQGSDRAILNWQSFSIGSQAAVNFKQPSSNAVALNRVLGADPSAIYGSLTANGQVFLVNPNGVLFGQGARVDVGGLVASTLSLRNEDFLAGKLRFSRDGATGSVVNQGSLMAKYVALLAPQVRNEGVIAAPMGTVALASGEAVTLGISGNRLIDVQVERSSIDALVENRHLVMAEGGTVVMSAQSAHSLVGKVVNTGMIEAGSISTDGGVVRLRASSAIEHSGSISADAGTNGKGGEITLIADLSNPASRTTVSGSLSARGGSSSGDGGFVETSASRLKISDSARVNTSAPHGRNGKWLLDPFDFTVAASDGDITGAALSQALGDNDVTIMTTDVAASCPNATCGAGNASGGGDIHVNDTVSWDSTKTLKLSAWRDININSPVNVNGAGTLAVEYGLGGTTDMSTNTARFTVATPVKLASGAAFTSKFGDGGSTKTYTVVYDIDGLTAIDADVAANYVLGSNIVITSGTWTPIGNTSGPFQGTFEGLGYTISGISTGTSVTDNVGFIGQTANGALIQNVGLTNVSISGRSAVGGLVGNNSGYIHNAYSTGSVSVTADTTTEAVSGIGGLVGQNNGFITRSYSGATVSATTGAQGDQLDPPIYGGGIGGLAGSHVGGYIRDSYATGNVTGGNNVGGFVGHAAADIKNSYSVGEVSGTGTVGGLIGSVATGGAVPPTIIGNFWDTEKSTKTASAGAARGMITDEMKTAANFNSATDANGNTDPAWDTARLWRLQNGSYPTFRGSELSTAASSITISLADSSRVYGDTAQPALTGFSFTGTLKSGDALTGAGWGSALTNNLAAGDYAYSTANLIAPTFAFSGAHTLADYSISFSSNKLTIQKANLTLGGTRTYDATTTVAGSLLTATGVLGESFAVNGSGTLASKDVGSRAVQSLGTLALGTASGGALASNYNALDVSGSAVNITKANLAVNGLSASNKVYDAGTGAPLSGTATVTPLGTDSVTLSGTAVGAFDNKNVGTGKSITVTGLTLTGTDAGNYNVVAPGTLTANVTAANLAVNGLSASGKTYDTTTVAPLSGTASVTPLGTDSISLSGTAAGAFADKNVGIGKSVTVTGLTLTGTDAGNYTLIAPGSLTANITAANLAVNGLSAADKVYDAGTGATLSGTASVTPLGADSISLSGTAAGAFANKNVGTGKPISITGLALTGTDAGNYTLVAPASLTANITAANLAVNGLSATDKIYDATNGATLTGTASVTPLGTDNVTLSGTAAGAFTNKNVGTGKAITVSGLALTGTDAGNYILVAPGTLTANVTAANLTVSGLSATDKVYDSTTDATLSGTASVAPLRTDNVTVAGTGSGAFADRHAGTSKPVAVSGFSLTGADASNYTIVQPTGLAATITPAPLTLSSSDVVKTYDNKSAAPGGSLVVASGSLFGSDTVSGGSFAFTDLNAGTGKTVNVSGITVSDGNEGRNYAITFAPNTTSTILVRPLSTWTGGAGNNLWSASGNWDALPNASNVLNVSIPTGVTVNYDLAGITNLQSIASAGTLGMSAGTLSLSGALNTSGYSQTAGAVSAGSLTVTNSFSQTGGAITLSGTASITHNPLTLLQIATLTAPTVTITAPNAGIVQNGPLTTELLTYSMPAGQSVQLTDPGNQIASLIGSGGALSLVNTAAPLEITSFSGESLSIDNTGGIVTTGPVDVPVGNMSVVSHSPITIGGQGVRAGGSIQLTSTGTAGNDSITINAPLTSTGGAVQVRSADGVSVSSNAAISAAGNIQLASTGTTGNDNITINAPLSSAGGAVQIQSAAGVAVNANISAATSVSATFGTTATFAPSVTVAAPSVSGLAAAGQSTTPTPSTVPAALTPVSASAHRPSPAAGPLSSLHQDFLDVLFSQGARNDRKEDKSD